MQLNKIHFKYYLLLYFWEKIW